MAPTRPGIHVCSTALVGETLTKQLRYNGLFRTIECMMARF